jgi:general secretion pathway protein H
MSRRAARPGFSLLELTVVLLILALAAAVAVPAFLAYVEEDDLDTATRRVQALLRLARDSAVRGASPVTVRIDSATATVWLDSPGSPAAAHAPAGQPLELPATVRLELAAARAAFTFLPGGAAFGDTLALRSGAAVRRVTVQPWTGDAVIH